MNKRRAILNMIVGGLLVAVALAGGIAAVASIRLVMSLPR